MRRLHLLEIEDEPWCPRAIRDGATDWLHFLANAHKGFNVISVKLREAMRRVGSDRIVDLCSGGGGPWQTLAPLLAQSGCVTVQLTDFYPNRAAHERVSAASTARVTYVSEPVDAMDVPSGFDGVRTMFNAFHHFRPHDARAILADAVAKRRAIVIVEGADHRLLGILFILLMPLMMLALTPLIRPFRWSRLGLTYVLPVIPLLCLFDGIVSMLRIYNPDELREMVASIPDEQSFEWDIGTQPVHGSPLGLTYLVGVPRGPAG
ncbi:class I SAM-dependent methyltransferase [Paraburkholderia sp. HP33-1]|uniref:class I SAM-dependent methyltransferase n=1 Tax=Paraburkholderia sp. HP33-1 TaxID=2883243 RepID=UPI001F2E8744|nr:class I SAM-dependent methyltransferase [Paraburkholderia sp. HP33-1]